MPKEIKFRKLKANEIECRIGTISGKGLSLLLYKDARCDMNLLDEVVGPMNWRRDHTRDNQNCIVSIYDEDKCQLAYNTERNEYRAMKDDMSEYFTLKAYQKLTSINQEFTADLTYTVSGDAKTKKGLTFKIEKISNESGLIWVWCKDGGIGAVIKLF